MEFTSLSKPRASVLMSSVCVLTLLTAAPSAKAESLLDGTPVTILTELNGVQEQAVVTANVASGQVDSPNPPFSWMIAGDSFDFSYDTRERFKLVLNGAHTFDSSDVLKITYELPEGFVFANAFLSRAIDYVRGFVDGRRLGFEVTKLDLISSVHGYTGLGGQIELSANVRSTTPANTAPQVTCSAPSVLECAPAAGLMVAEQVAVTDLDAGQTLTLILKSGDIELDQQTVATPVDDVLVQFDPVLLEPGSHPLTVWVSDGFTSISCSSSVAVTYSWSGLFQPINADGSSVFRAGSTVPVKFRLTCESAAITDLSARLSVAKISNAVVGPVNEAASTSSATSGNLFRYDPLSGQYVFNWSTKGLDAGTYQLQIVLGDGILRAVHLGLR